MIVLVLTACPPGLRGHLTRWLIEVSAGVFVGHCSARVRDELWDRVLEYAKNGRALMAYSTRTEQRFAIRHYGHHWDPEDLDGITLLRRPHDAAPDGSAPPKSGWSSASRRRRYGSRAKRK